MIKVDQGGNPSSSSRPKGCNPSLSLMETRNRSFFFRRSKRKYCIQSPFICVVLKLMEYSVTFKVTQVFKLLEQFKKIGFESRVFTLITREQNFKILQSEYKKKISF